MRNQDAWVPECFAKSKFRTRSTANTNKNNKCSHNWCANQLALDLRAFTGSVAGIVGKIECNGSIKSNHRSECGEKLRPEPLTISVGYLGSEKCNKSTILACKVVSKENRSCFGSDLCYLPPFARRVFHCFRPALPAFFGFWVKSGSGTGDSNFSGMVPQTFLT